MGSMESGAQVAKTIGIVKWILISLAGLACIITAARLALEDNSVSYALTMALATVAITAAWCLFIWVLFGWFEHTLLALVTIARNTSPTYDRSER